MATHSSTLAWKIPWMEKPGRLQSMGSQRVGHDWDTSLSLAYIYIYFIDVTILWYFSLPVLSLLFIPAHFLSVFPFYFFSKESSNGHSRLTSVRRNGNVICLMSLDLKGSYAHFGLPWWLNGKASACNAGDPSLIPGSGRSPGKGNGYLL